MKTHTLKKLAKALAVYGCTATMAITMAVSTSAWADIPAAYTITDLGPISGDNHADAYGINNSGQSVGDTADTSTHYNACAWGANGAISYLGALPNDSCSTAYAVNNSGVAVGFSGQYHSDGTYGNAVVWQNGGITKLPTLGGTYAVAYGINDSGQVAGWAQNTAGYWHAVIWQNGGITDLGAVSGKDSSEAWGINSSGWVAGFSWTSTHGWPPDWCAFVGKPGQALTQLGGYGGLAQALALNDSGQVVGWANIQSGSLPHAVLWDSNGGMRDLGVLPGWAYSGANSINDSGQVVGDSVNSNDTDGRAFIWDNNVMVDLNTLIPTNSGWRLTWATGINDEGQIIGGGYNPSGESDAFLLTPIPEPSSSVLALFGASLAVLSARWKGSKGRRSGLHSRAE
jgi:probable HAF family extracellular repeat protein